MTDRGIMAPEGAPNWKAGTAIEDIPSAGPRALHMENRIGIAEGRPMPTMKPHGRAGLSERGLIREGNHITIPAVPVINGGNDVRLVPVETMITSLYEGGKPVAQSTELRPRRRLQDSEVVFDPKKHNRNTTVTIPELLEQIAAVEAEMIDRNINDPLNLSNK